ncbi:MAG: hypothetical protein V4592_20265 [Bacteroidota bacterium]
MKVILIVGISLLFVMGLLWQLLKLPAWPYPHLSLFVLIIYLATILNNIKIYKNELKAFCAILLVFIYAIVYNRHLYFFGYINAMILPPLVYVAMNNTINYKVYKSIFNIIIVMFVATIIVSYIERAFQTKLFLIKNDVLISEDVFEEQFRSNGLMGGPLGSSQFVLLVYASLMAMGSIVQSKKIYITFLVLISMMCFNARASTIAELLTFAIFFFSRVSVSRVVTGILAMVAFSFLVYYSISELGIGTRALDIFQDDSSSVRLAIFNLFNFLDVNNILWGPETSFLAKQMKHAQLDDVIIENPLLVYIFQVGLIMTIILVFSYITFFSKISMGLTKHQKILLFTPTVISILSNISVAGGSAILSYLVIMIMLVKYDSQNNTPLLALR